MNKKIKSIDFFQRVVDLLIVLVSWWMAYLIRFVAGVGGESQANVQFGYAAYGMLLMLVSLIVFKNMKMYDTVRYESSLKEISTQVKANVFAFLFFLTLSFFLSKFRLSRIVLISYLSISSTLLILSKVYFKNWISKFPVKLVLVGNGSTIQKYYEEIKRHKNFKLVFWIDGPKDLDSEIVEKDTLSVDALEGVVDSLVIGYDLKDSHKSHEYLSQLTESLIPIILLPDLQFSKLGHTFKTFKNQPLIYLNEPKLKTFDLVLKRAFDVICVSLGLIVISPLLLLIAFLVKLGSKGPVFYGQERMGLDGKKFKMWKFRSMVVGGKNTEGWTVKNDPRVTPIGKFLRKTSLDELPQLWNVLTGDMSLVGPRPERPVYVDQFKKEISSYMLRHKFKAGITGWAQINGWRGDTSIEKRIECDLWYIKNWSLGLDLNIVFMTFWKGFISKNAY